MAVNFKSEEEVKEFLKNLGIEYRFGCYSEKRGEVCHLLGDYLEAIDRNFEKAAKLYKNTCDEHKYARSCRKYATYALLGKGMKHPEPRTSYEYFEKGCNLDEPNACLHQGLLLLTEDPSIRKEVDRNFPKALEKMKKACSLDEANACYYLSGMYISGVKNPLKEEEYVLEKNLGQAFKFTAQGCKLGNIYCCANLSQMYDRGEGVKADPELATKYKKMALDMQDEARGVGGTLSFQQGVK